MNTLNHFKRALLACAVAGLAMTGAARASDDATMERDLTVAQKPIYNFGQQQIAGRMEVDAYVDNPNLTYAIGQPFRVIVKPRRDAYITIVDVGSSGRVSILFPNHFQRESRVHGGATVMIPMDRSQWEVKVSGPPGVDLIQVIASQNPLSLPELNQLVRTSESSPLITLGRSADEFSRDLTAQLKPQFGGPGGPGPQNYGVRNLMIRVVEGYPGYQGYAGGGAGGGVNPYGGPGGNFGGGGGGGFGGGNYGGGYGPDILPPIPTSAYGLSIRTDRPAYRVGQPVRVMVQSRTDCRLTLVSVGPSGRVTQLFPNRYQRDNMILAGQVVMVPSGNSPLRITAQGPAGVEGLIGTCRDAFGGPTATFDNGSDGFVNLGTIQTYGRDLMANVPGGPDSGPQGNAGQGNFPQAGNFPQGGPPSQGGFAGQGDAAVQGGVPGQGNGEQTSTSYVVIE